MQLIHLHPTLSVRWQRDGARVRVLVAGELDLVTGERLRRWLRTVADSSSAVQMDLYSVSFCDAAGVRALHHLSAASMGVSFVRVPELVRRVAELCGVDLRDRDQPDGDRADGHLGSNGPAGRAPAVRPQPAHRPPGNGH